MGSEMAPGAPTILPRRSVLYMPGSNARAIEKARTLPADCVILDLEDAVAPDAKAAARAQVAAALAAGGFGTREVVVRINPLASAWGRDDLAAVATAGPHAVLAPKVESPDGIAEIELALESARAPAALAVWAMIETPLAILRVEAVAAAAARELGRLRCFVLGTNDLAKETRARLVPGRAPMLGWLSTAVAAARAYGLDVLDGVFNDIADDEGFRAECAQGRDFGFDGKTLIHPSQIEAANEIFAPSADEVASARQIIAAFARPENAGLGVVSLDGRMVERLHADMAARTVALADAIEAARGGT